jgi:magnesium-transporting ATPase (P-type)
MQTWYALDIEHVTHQLHTDLQTGLTGAEAQHRLQQYGPNELQASARISPWVILLEQCKNILILILLLAVGLSALLGHTVEAIAIAVIVSLSDWAIVLALALSVIPVLEITKWMLQRQNRFGNGAG